MKISVEKRTYWEKHLSAWKGSSLSQASYCIEAGISYSSFKNWKNRLNGQSRIKPQHFVEATSVDLEKVTSNALVLQISLANGSRISVSAQASSEVVRQVLSLAGGSSCFV